MLKNTSVAHILYRGRVKRIILAVRFATRFVVWVLLRTLPPVTSLILFCIEGAAKVALRTGFQRSHIYLPAQ